MRRRWTVDKITLLLRQADRDPAEGLPVFDICRKHGIGQSMYYRSRFAWRSLTSFGHRLRTAEKPQIRSNDRQ